MNKTERYEKALELINRCLERDKLVKTVTAMGGNMGDYLETKDIDNHNKADMCAVMRLIDKCDLKEFVEKQLSNNVRIPNMSYRYMENYI